MQLSLFGYTLLLVLVGAPIVAIAALITLIRRGRVSVFDFGALLLPPFAFILVGVFRPPLHVGWAMVIWPIFIATVVMYLFGLRVLLFDRGTSRGRAPPVVFFALSVTAGLLLGATVPPLYE
jgi:hypothetical protein